MNITVDSFDHRIFGNAIEQLEYVIGLSPEEGEFLEFGVFEGRSIRALANMKPEKQFYGFDSFEGLPEDWIRGEGKVYKKGHFSTSIPEVPSNVTLIPGFFEQSLPRWLEKTAIRKVSLLHIDSDLYSSAVTILEYLDSYILPGTIIVFDELCDWTNKNVYDKWEEGEWKALHQWVSDRGREVCPISRTTHYSAALRVLK